MAAFLAIILTTAVNSGAPDPVDSRPIVQLSTSSAPAASRPGGGGETPHDGRTRGSAQGAVAKPLPRAPRHEPTSIGYPSSAKLHPRPERPSVARRGGTQPAPSAAGVAAMPWAAPDAEAGSRSGARDGRASRDRASRDRASRDKASQDKASQDKASQDKASQDLNQEWPGYTHTSPYTSPYSPSGSGSRGYY